MTAIAIVGEAWGEQEERQRIPFVGPSGYLLNQLLDESGIRRADCYLTNVFNLRPRPMNDVINLCGPKANSHLPPLSNGKYLRSEYYGELKRLEAELNEVKPNLVFALGGTALWAVTGTSAISKNRGAIGYTSTTADFLKAARESAFPEVRRPERVVYVDPTFEDIVWFYQHRMLSAKYCAIDIETKGDAITCIGFATSTSEAFVIPFEDMRKPNNSYWATPREERMAWVMVKQYCQSPARKVFQNGLYDLRFLWQQYGIAVANCTEDTMLLHHALQPESPKGLAYLGSVYTNEASWKLMRTKTIKKDS